MKLDEYQEMILAQREASMREAIEALTRANQAMSELFNTEETE